MTRTALLTHLLRCIRVGSTLVVLVASALPRVALGQVPNPSDGELELEVEASSPPEASSVPADPSPELTALRTQLAALEGRVAEDEAERLELRQALAEAQSAAGDAQARAEHDLSSLLARLAKRGVSISGYLQVQYGQNQISEDELLQGGTPLNQDRFAVRRGRLRVNGRFSYVHTDLELDASNTRGPTASVRRASVTGLWPAEGDGPTPLSLTVGLTEIPFGLELQQGQDDILFLERTTGSLAFFAGPVDTGAKLQAAYGPFRVQLAVMNGVPLDDRAGGPSAIDATRAPDYLGRVGVETALAGARIEAGASFLSGTGFHAGSDATKSVLQWDDQNADGQFSTTEVVQVAGRGALPSATFKRWAVGADARLELDSKLGQSTLYGEITLATNLDRALFVADPTLRGSDLRELSFYVALLQDVTPWAFIGARYDVYDPDSDLIDTRRGRAFAWDASIKTLSPVVGARWADVGRLTFQYDLVDDRLGRDRRGIPIDVANNQWTVRAQGQF